MVEPTAADRLPRRRFLTGGLALAGCMPIRDPEPLPTSAGNAAVADAISETIAIDMHNHVYPAGTEPRPRNDPKRAPELFLLDQLARSGFTAVCASFVLDFAPNKQPGDARATLMRWFDALDAQLEQGQVRRALRLEDLRVAQRTRRPTIVQSVEGAMFIEGNLERLGEAHQRGLRHLQLLHERDDLVSPLGDTNTIAPHLGGLTRMGASVVKECNRLGIVVDLAHASQQTILGALEAATQPLIVSHTSLDTFTSENPKLFEMMKPRLISKQHAQVVADAGGVIGVWTHLADSLPHFVDSIKAMVDAVGADHVGIGTDTDLLSSRVGQGTNRTWPELTEPFFDSLVAAMLQQGFSREEVRKIGGGNFCRVFDQVTLAPSTGA